MFHENPYLIFPTSVEPSGDRTWNSTSPQILYVQIGPSIVNATCPCASKRLYLGASNDLYKNKKRNLWLKCNHISIEPYSNPQKKSRQ